MVVGEDKILHAEKTNMGKDAVLRANVKMAVNAW
jgi:hypothetical protein